MKLAELVIQLSANTASLKKDFEQAKRQASEFASSMKSALSGIGIGLSVAGISEAIRGLVEYEHSMSDAAAATGMTVEQISGFSFALKSTGVPLNELQLGLAQFDKIISGLMRSKAGASAITALGLSMKNLHSEGAHQALLDVADAFKKIPDGSEKAGIAAALFTATLGQKLIPILDRGKAGILALEEEAKRLGVVLTDKEVQAADQTYTAFIQVDAAMRGMEISAGTRLFPALIQISEALLGNSYALEAFKGGIEEMGLEAVKLATYLNPATYFQTGGLRKKIDQEIAQIETDILVARHNLDRQMKALTIPGSGLGKGTIQLPQIILPPGAKIHIDQVANSIRQLKEDLIGLSQGDAERSIQHLRDLGASPTQLSQANALLNQIAATKQQQEAIRQLADANRDYDRLVDSLSDSIIHLDSAQNDYIKTVAQLNLLESQGVNITEGLTLAREKYRQSLLSQIQTPAQRGEKPEGNFGGIFAGAMNVPGEPTLTLMQKMEPMAKELGRTLSSGFEGMVISGKGFNQMLMRMTTLFSEFLMKAIVFKELANVFGSATGNAGGASQSGGATGGKGSSGGGISGVLGSLFSGLAGSLAGRASGGPVTAGQLYMVGENGPEMFAPGMSGSIIPSGGSMGSRGAGTNVNIDARGADAGVEHRIYRAMQAMQKQGVGQSLVVNYEYQARGGVL